MSYVTIKGLCAAELVEKRSRFIASASPVTRESEAKAFVAQIKARHPDARHNVFAYSLRGGGQRCSDDGEPQGSAGQPVLNVITRRGLVDVAVVVTRYFGGVLLGAPGLLRAYTQSATQALDAAQPLEMRRALQYQAVIDYSLITRVQQLISSIGGRVSGADYGANVSMELIVFEETEEVFLKSFTSLTNGAFVPVLKNEIYVG
jgi:uncharacterized YigZ family protein